MDVTGQMAKGIE